MSAAGLRPAAEAAGPLRLFVALDLPETVRGEIARRMEPLRRRLPPARWVRPETLHLTLVFLGEVEAGRLPGLTDRLAEPFAGSAAPRLCVAGGGAFPPSGPARVAWVGVEAGEELPSLQGKVAAAATAAAGVAPEPRPFRPHLTVARCSPPWPLAARERFAEAFAGPLGEPFVAREGILYHSLLGAGGARHTAVASFPLGGA